MNKLFSFHRLEYIFFVIIILYLSVVNFNRSNHIISNSQENSKLSKIRVEYKTKNVLNENVSGVYTLTNKYINEAIIYKHDSKKLWLYRFKEFVSEDEDNIYWVLGNKDPINKNKDPINKNKDPINILFRSVIVSEMDQYYIYQYIDYGLHIEKGTMFYKNNNKISIDLFKID
jgi:hypothetical protein